ncbi:unnamed protein product [Alopecurus aequalis]
MAALLRQGARRIGGSLLQRTQAAATSPAVAEERRLLVPRRMATDTRPSEEDVLQKKEALYEVLSKRENWRNMALLQDLAVHVEPKPQDTQWRQLKLARRVHNFAEAIGTALFFSFVFAAKDAYGTYAASVKQVKM